jgi:hypothetical protein
MKINTLGVMRGVFMMMVGIGTIVVTFDTANSWHQMPGHVFLFLVLSGSSLLLVGAVELLCVLYRLGIGDMAYISNVDEARRKRAAKALYYEFYPFFKSGNDIPVPNANIPGDLGRKVSAMLLDYATKK